MPGDLGSGHSQFVFAAAGNYHSSCAYFSAAASVPQFRDTNIAAAFF
jgi:hypothetical protein